MSALQIIYNEESGLISKELAHLTSHLFLPSSQMFFSEGLSLFFRLSLSLCVSMGVGREASKAQCVRRARPQDALFNGVFFCACSFVLLYLSGRPVVGVAGSKC